MIYFVTVLAFQKYFHLLKYRVFKKLATVRISKTINPTENLQHRLYNILFRDLKHILRTLIFGPHLSKLYGDQLE